jgi:hypothetical protein
MNDITSGLRGKFGEYFVFRIMRGKTFVSRRGRKPGKGTETVAQRSTRDTFRRASAWAKEILLVPQQKEYFRERAKQLNLPNAYTAAVKEFMIRNSGSTKKDGTPVTSDQVPVAGSRGSSINYQDAASEIIPMQIKMLKGITFYFLVAFFLIGCSGSSIRKGETDLSSLQWKYGEGFNAGDWLNFENDLSLRNDTIFRRDSAVAIIVEIEDGKFGDDDEMVIRSMNGDTRGTYHSK